MIGPGSDKNEKKTGSVARFFNFEKKIDSLARFFNFEKPEGPRRPH